jgi:hypothetical protein
LARRRTIAIEIDARDSYGAMRMLAPARRRGVGSPRAPIRAAGTVLVCRLPCARIFQALLARPHGIAKAAPAGFQNTRSEPLFMQVLEPRQETLNVYVRYICLVRVIEDAQHLNARGPQSGCRVLVHYALLHSPRPLARSAPAAQPSAPNRPKVCRFCRCNSHWLRHRPYQP